MTLLQIAGLTAGYGDFQALFGIDMTIATGQAVAIIGANGAGKTTLLRAIAGQLPARPDAIRFDGTPIGGMAPERVVRRGIAMVPEGRRLFPSLTVEENLRIGTQCGRRGPWTLPRIFRLFPALLERRHQPAMTLSGGQQQMAAIGRALLANPSLLLCDEISLGLAPVVIRDIYETLPAIRTEGTTLLIVEQDINRALQATDQVYCLQEGRVTLQGAPADLTRAQIKHAYFGV
jgi:branched-chain amino acid transport system ATP-binding protein